MKVLGVVTHQTTVLKDDISLLALKMLLPPPPPFQPTYLVVPKQ